MPYLTTLFPDPDVLLALAPEELGPIVLGLAREARSGTNMLPADVDVQVDHSPVDPKGYPHSRKDQVRLALSEAWNWLRVHGLVVPADNDPGSPWVRLSRRGAALLNSNDFVAFRQAAAFPKTLLHPAIADEVWLDLARGDYETAIFRAFKRIEVAVRAASGLTDAHYGLDLIKAAFLPKTGILADKSGVGGEPEALYSLFVGAVGRYRNPNAHRDLSLDHTEAQEVVMLASHLLRIVDTRRSR